jgi:DNA-binding CsgD family transcriptional regulator
MKYEPLISPHKQTDKTILHLPVDKLNREEKEILELYFVDGYTEKEIAKQLRCSQKYVHNIYQGIQKKMRETFYGGKGCTSKKIAKHFDSILELEDKAMEAKLFDDEMKRWERYERDYGYLNLD